MALLLGACTLSIVLLLSLSDPSSKQLEGIAQADSLLRRDLTTFNISRQQVQEHTIQVNDSFSRRLYDIHLPPGFSKTHLHQEIHDTFYEYGVSAPARVIFPAKDVHIHLIQNNTIFATLRLETDSSLRLARSFGSILVALDHYPSQEMLQRIESLGESIPIVLKMQDLQDMEELPNDIRQGYEELLIWLQEKEGDDSRSLLPTLQHLQRVAPGAGVLSFQNPESGGNQPFIQALSETSIDIVDASESILLQSAMGKDAFNQELQKFMRRARRGEHPVAILMADERALDWLQEELVTLKKSGLRIVPPKENRFSND